MFEKYLYLGFTHVLPLGLDHLLFIICLVFISKKLKTIIIQCSVFTLAHTSSLLLSSAGYMVTNTNIVEPLIACTILFTALQIMVSEAFFSYNVLITFIFGLIHGLGFATALKEIEVDQQNTLIAILSFNIGVEIAQLIIVTVCYVLVVLPLHKKNWYRNTVVLPLASLIACIALYWTIVRILE